MRLKQTESYVIGYQLLHFGGANLAAFAYEEEAAADFLQNYIEESGIMTGRSGNNIWCISPMFDTNRPTILLNSHIDTVKPVNGWRKQPFTPKMENGKLYGLGSNDAGASVVSLFQAYRYLTQTEQSYNLKKCRAREASKAFCPNCPRLHWEW